MSWAAGILIVLGALLAFSGSLGLLRLKSFYERVHPPTMGTTEVDPKIKTDIVLEWRDWEPAPALSNSFAFGGHNGSIVLAPV